MKHDDELPRFQICLASASRSLPWPRSCLASGYAFTASVSPWPRLFCLGLVKNGLQGLMVECHHHLFSHMVKLQY